MKCCDCGKEFMAEPEENELFENAVFRTFLKERWRFLIKKDGQPGIGYKILCSDCADKRYAELYRKTGNSAYKKHTVVSNVPLTRQTLESTFSEENVKKMKRNAKINDEVKK